MIRKSAIAIGALVVLGLGARSEALTGSTVTVSRGTPPGAPSCTVDKVSDAVLLNFELKVGDVLEKSRRIANSKAFQDCLRQTMETGYTLADGRTYGPFRGDSRDLGTHSTGQPATRSVIKGASCDEAVACPSGEMCSAHYGTLPHKVCVKYQDDSNSTLAMPDNRRRHLYAERAITEALSPNHLSIVCQTGVMSSYVPLGVDRTLPEGLKLSHNYFNALCCQTTGATPTSCNSCEANVENIYPATRRAIAGIIWHEAMHARGYFHGVNGTNDADDPINAKQLPDIVGACMDHVYKATLDNPACTKPQVASPFPLLNTCQTVEDPFPKPPASAPALRYTGVSWYVPDFAQLVVDGTGTAYVRQGAATGKKISQLIPDGTLAHIGAGNTMAAGGDAVIWLVGIHFNPFYMSWVLQPKVGAPVSWTDGYSSSMVLDGFGAPSRTSGIGVERLQGNSWVNLGSPASQLFAGGDQLFKTDAVDGNQYRFSSIGAPWTWVGGPAAEMAVDSYGVLYHLNPSRTLVYRNPSKWSWVGSGSAKIDAGDAFYSTPALGGWVYRQFLNQGWQAVTECDTFAVGGRALYCYSATYGQRVYEFR